MSFKKFRPLDLSGLSDLELYRIFSGELPEVTNVLGHNSQCPKCDRTSAYYTVKQKPRLDDRPGLVLTRYYKCPTCGTKWSLLSVVERVDPKWMQKDIEGFKKDRVERNKRKQELNPKVDKSLFRGLPKTPPSDSDELEISPILNARDLLKRSQT